jgi:hypothetical protein
MRRRAHSLTQSDSRGEKTQKSTTTTTTTTTKTEKKPGKKNLKSVGMPRDVIRKDRTTKSFRNASGNE